MPLIQALTKALITPEDQETAWKAAKEPIKQYVEAEPE
jgi:predicted RNA-binding protein associated with RNAse of E/G family